MADFAVRTTARFERLARSHSKRRHEFPKLLEEAIAILANDPYNRAAAHAIKKLTGLRVARASTGCG